MKNGHGDALIKGKNVTGFSDTEEAAVKLSKVVPFLLEDELKKNGCALQQGALLGRLCENRRVADHGTESRLLRRSGQGIA